LDNLRRSLLDPSILLLMLGGWFLLPGVPGYWTAVAIGILLLPVYCDFLFALLRVPKDHRALAAWVRNTVRALANGHAIALFGLVFLLHGALLSLDAIAHDAAGLRDREKAARMGDCCQAEASAPSKSTVDMYLEWTLVRHCWRC
jgi:cyclic beta-1,2-glucan synthetase